MSQKLNKLSDQKIKIGEDIKKVNKKKESNRDKTIELYKEIKTIHKRKKNS